MTTTTTTTTTLNRDIYDLIIEEVIGQLNHYRTKELVDFAHRLRLVDRASDKRLSRITSRYLYVPSDKALQKLVLANVPGWEKHEWVTIRRDGTDDAAFEGFLSAYRKSESLVRLVLDLRNLFQAELQRFYRLPLCPASVHELLMLPYPHPGDEWNATNLLDSFLWNGSDVHDLKLAISVIPNYFGLVDPPCHATIAIFIRPQVGLYGIGRLIRFANRFAKGCLLRVTFSNISPCEYPGGMKEHLMLSALESERLEVEEVSPPDEGGYSFDWFSGRVLDGTIWTVPSRPLSIEG